MGGIGKQAICLDEYAPIQMGVVSLKYFKHALLVSKKLRDASVRPYRRLLMRRRGRQREALKCLGQVLTHKAGPETHSRRIHN